MALKPMQNCFAACNDETNTLYNGIYDFVVVKSWENMELAFTLYWHDKSHG